MCSCLRFLPDDTYLKLIYRLKVGKKLNLDKPSGNVKLIDLSKMVGTRNSFVTALRKSVSDEKAKVKKEYLLPNYVAGCCRAAGFDGIKYRGSNYKCHVLWNDTKMDIAHYLEPKRIKEYLK